MSDLIKFFAHDVVPLRDVIYHVYIIATNVMACPLLLMGLLELKF